jgi:hypothetical protein
MTTESRTASNISIFLGGVEGGALLFVTVCTYYAPQTRRMPVATRTKKGPRIPATPMAFRVSGNRMPRIGGDIPENIALKIILAVDANANARLYGIGSVSRAIRALVVRTIEPSLCVDADDVPLCERAFHRIASLTVVGYPGGAISDIRRLSFRGGLFTAPILSGVRVLALFFCMCDLSWISELHLLESLSIEGLDACVEPIDNLKFLQRLRIARMRVRALDTMCRIRPPALRVLTVESIIHQNSRHYVSTIGRLSRQYDVVVA